MAAERTRAGALAREPAVKKALSRDRDALHLETRQLSGPRHRSAPAEPGYAGDESRPVERDAGRVGTRRQRSRARRLLGQLAVGAGRRIDDDEYRALLQQYRWRG